MGKSSAPATPDYRGAAEETAASNKESLAMQTYANRANQNTPWGSSNWSNKSVWDPSSKSTVMEWTQNEKLSPELQAALDSQINLSRDKSDLAGGMMGRVGQEFGSEMDWSKFGDVQGMDWDKYGSPEDPDFEKYGEADDVDWNKYGKSQNLQYAPDELRQRAEDDAYKRQTNRLDPQFSSQRDALELKLRNQGLRAGDQAWNSSMETFGQQKNDAYEQARLGSTDIGRNEAQQLYNQQMGSTQYANQLRSQGMDEGLRASQYSNALRTQGIGEEYKANEYQNKLRSQGMNEGFEANKYANSQRQQQIQEEMSRRGFSLNEMNAIMSGEQVQNPRFQSYGQAGKAPGTDYSGAAMNQSNFDQAAYQQQNSGLSSMLGTGMRAASIFGMAL